MVAATMLLTTLSLFHVAAALLCRDQLNTIFDRSAIPGVMQLRRYGLALLAIVLVTALDFLQRIFDTDGAQLRPVVHLRRHRRVPRRRGGADQARPPAPVTPPARADPRSEQPWGAPPSPAAAVAR